MNKDNILVGNIQRFCVNDGPGIRTTIFLKGCPLRCPWCCNPENILMEQQFYIENGIEKCFGKYYTVDELKKIILKDKLYYEEDGGVTFSGGDPILQSNKLITLLKEIKKERINICFETSLFIPNKNLIEIIDYIDLLYIDIKILDKEKCNKYLNGNIDIYLNNMETVFNKNKKVIFRIPLVDEYTNEDCNIDLIIDFLKKYKPIKVEIFSVHNLGEKKYKLLNLKYNKFEQISDGDLNKIKKRIEKEKIKCDIIKI